MKQSIFTVKSNQHLTDTVLKMVLAGDTSAITASGQFVNIKLDGFFLRRPISVCDYNEKTLTILYKVVGKGTQYLSTLAAGKQLDILTGLGNPAHRRRRRGSSHVPSGKKSAGRRQKA